MINNLQKHDYIHYVLLVLFILIYVAFDIYNFFLPIYFQLERAYDQIILPLENFRKEHIGGVKVDIFFSLYHNFSLFLFLTLTKEGYTHILFHSYTFSSLYRTGRKSLKNRPLSFVKVKNVI